MTTREDEERELLKDRWLYLKDSRTYLNMNNVDRVASNTDGYLISYFTGGGSFHTKIVEGEYNDAAKIIEWLDRRAYC